MSITDELLRLWVAEHRLEAATLKNEIHHMNLRPDAARRKASETLSAHELAVDALEDLLQRRGAL